MAKMFFVKDDDGDCLYPSCDDAALFVKRLKPGHGVIVEATVPRNIKAHKLFWGMCSKLADACPGDYSAENIADVLKLRTGHSVIVKTKRGEIELPKSISFASMDDVAFSSFLDACINVVCRDFLDIPENQARRELLDIVKIKEN